MTDTTKELALAKRFHEAYERLAPSYGYATREDTKNFDPTSPNGQLMIAVCKEAVVGELSFYETEAREWRALYEKQRGGAVFTETVNENVELRKELMRLKQSTVCTKPTDFPQPKMVTGDSAGIEPAYSTSYKRRSVVVVGNSVVDVPDIDSEGYHMLNTKFVAPGMDRPLDGTPG